jgi:hypothetical protein
VFLLIGVNSEGHNAFVVLLPLEPVMDVDFRMWLVFLDQTFILGDAAAACSGHSTLTKLYFALNWIRGAFALLPFCSRVQP